MSRNTLALLLLSVSGCVAPADGQFLCREAPQTCPSGMQCDDGVCRTQLSEPDANPAAPDSGFDVSMLDVSMLDVLMLDATTLDTNAPDDTDPRDTSQVDAGLPLTRTELCAASDAQCLDFESALPGGWSSYSVGGPDAESAVGGYLSDHALLARGSRSTSTIRFPSVSGSRLYVSARVMVSRMGGPAASNAILFGLSDSPSGEPTRAITLGQFFDPLAAADTQQIARLTTTEDGASMTAEANPFYLDEWRCLELLVVDEGGTSTVSAWVEDIPTGSSMGPAVSTLPFLDIGLATAAETPITVRIDDVYVGTARVGCLPGPAANNL